MTSSLQDGSAGADDTNTSGRTPFPSDTSLHTVLPNKRPITQREGICSHTEKVAIVEIDIPCQHSYIEGIPPICDAVTVNPKCVPLRVDPPPL